MLRSTIKALLDKSSSFERHAQIESSAPSSDHAAAVVAALAPLGYGLVDGSEVRALPSEGYVDVQVFAGPKAKWKDKPGQMQQIKSILDPICIKIYGFPSKPVIST
jgi:hypothetical protein